MPKIFLDAGHGGKDPGAIGNGLKEKDITLSLALITGSILEAHGVEVYYSRTTDVYLDLTTRAKMANQKKVDAFVSVHVNSATNSAATGLEIFTTKGQTAGDKLATSVGGQLKSDFPSLVFRADYSDGDIDKESNFTVITKTNMAACLVEYLFIVNPKDAQILKTKQMELAISTAKGILKHFGIKYVDNAGLNLIVNGQLRKVNGLIKNGISYITVGDEDIAARTIGEALGFVVGWNESKKAVTFND